MPGRAEPMWTDEEGIEPPEPPLLRSRVVAADPAPRRRSRRTASVCLKCRAPIVPLVGHPGLAGGFGHRPDCPDRGVDPSSGDLLGRWRYGEPGWDCPVVLCAACGEAAMETVGEDEDFVVLPASSVEDWNWVQWLHEHPAENCWECRTALPEVRRG